MKEISQKDIFGCGVACTASLLKISYKKSLLLFKSGEEKSKKFGFLCKEISHVITKNTSSLYSYSYINKRGKSKIYKDGTIVFIKRSKKYPSGHYLLRVNNMWMDPWVNFSENKNIKKAKSGFRKRLPGKPIYFIYKL